MTNRKFRGQTKDGKWVYGWYVGTNEEETKHFILHDEKGFIEVLEPTVGQATGLKDLDFWQGDILESEDKLRRYEIRWNDRQGCWYLHGLGKAWCVNEPLWHEYTKVGTIHDGDTK